VRATEGGVDTKLFPAARFYAALRRLEAFSGSELNIEGLTDVGHGHLRLFQRGNGVARNGVAAVDVSLAELLAFVDAPATAPVPRLSNPVRYQLGALDGVRLTFSDAARRGRSVLFLAAAEASADSTHDGGMVGSVLGIIDPDGTVRWVQIMDDAGKPVRDKPEGICVDPHDANRLWLVTDADDPDRPSELLEVILNGPWGEEH
jgi:hypothetical protein